jgi:hypothetical protein
MGWLTSASCTSGHDAIMLLLMVLVQHCSCTAACLLPVSGALQTLLEAVGLQQRWEELFVGVRSFCIASRLCSQVASIRREASWTHSSHAPCNAAQPKHTDGSCTHLSQGLPSVAYGRVLQANSSRQLCWCRLRSLKLQLSISFVLPNKHRSRLWSCVAGREQQTLAAQGLPS